MFPNILQGPRYQAKDPLYFKDAETQLKYDPASVPEYISTTRSLSLHTVLQDKAFSNSLIIHQVKTEKIISVKEVWIPGLN